MGTASRNHKHKKLVMRETDRVLIGLTSLALNAPSTYTIAWSKEQHPEQLPILYAGVTTSALTVGGAILGDRFHGDKIMILGLVATITLFGWVTFFYKPPTTVPTA